MTLFEYFKQELLKRGLTEADVPRIKGLLSKADTDWELEIDRKAPEFLALLDSILDLAITVYRLDMRVEALNRERITEGTFEE